VRNRHLPLVRNPDTAVEALSEPRLHGDRSAPVAVAL